MDLNFEGTKEEKAEYYSENWEHITGLDYEDCVPSEINRLDFLNGYNEAIKDTNFIELLKSSKFALEILKRDENPIFSKRYAISELEKSIEKALK